MKITKEEAIKIINFFSTEKFHDCCELAVNALELQIPVRPIKEGLSDRYCCKCGAYIVFDVLNDDIEDAPKYCSACGKAIDWSDENA